MKSHTLDKLSVRTNEEYALTIDELSARVIAETYAGALHGLQTFSQLVEFNLTRDGVLHYTVPSVHITDMPRFPHRGLLVDTSRHYLSMSTLERIVDDLAMVKANVLHWHITDGPSFPLWTKHGLHEGGAFSMLETYTTEDVKHFVIYAADRGVRVIPEIDMPGHVDSWYASHPEIFSPCTSGQYALSPEKKTYDFVESLLDEIHEIFPDESLHIGGDEIPVQCWTETAKERNTTTEGLFGEWLAAMHQIGRRLNRRITWWDEAALTSNPPPPTENTTIQVWRSSDSIAAIIDMGYKVIVSPADGKNNWYLDHLDRDFDSFYNLNFTGIGEERLDKVIGGEGCMWGESVDQSNAIPRIFPRMAAIAERLWSTEQEFDKDKLHRRIGQFRCKLISRGRDVGTLNIKGDSAGGPGYPSTCSNFYQTHEAVKRSDGDSAIRRENSITERGRLDLRRAMEL